MKDPRLAGILRWLARESRPVKIKQWDGLRYPVAYTWCEQRWGFYRDDVIQKELSRGG